VVLVDHAAEHLPPLNRQVHWKDGLVVLVGRSLLPGLVVCVPKTLSTSCGQAIFGDGAAGQSPSSDAVLLYFDWFG
jgi:hypothetical protein